MKVFVTGATGFVGTVVVEELIRYGHKVTGLARSPDSAEKLKRLGASVHVGSLEDRESLKSGAKNADGVINCAFSNDFSKFAESGQVEQRAIEALGQTLKGSSRPLVVTSGVALLTPGRTSTEEDPFPSDSPIPRNPESPALAFVKDGVRAMFVRLSPTTHGEGKGGFAGLLVDIARKKGVSAYVGAGENRWPAVHHKDAAQLFRLVLESGTAGTRYHAVAEQGVATKDIAVAIGHALNIPTVSISAEEAASHFGWFKDFAMIDTIASSELTRARLSWKPTHRGLIADLEAGLKPGR
jgi:nucleoside-diphosphate-sugar epimerase